MTEQASELFQCAECLCCFTSLTDVQQHQKQCTGPEIVVEFAGYAGGLQKPVPKPKRRNNMWPHEATALLITAYKERRADFANKNRRKYEVWDDVASVLIENGYIVNGDMCDKKMRGLKQRYKLLKFNDRLTGKENEVQWVFFDAMEDLMVHDPAVLALTGESPSTAPEPSTTPTITTTHPPLTDSLPPQPSTTAATAATLPRLIVYRPSQSSAKAAIHPRLVLRQFQPPVKADTTDTPPPLSASCPSQPSDTKPSLTSSLAHTASSALKPTTRFPHITSRAPQPIPRTPQPRTPASQPESPVPQPKSPSSSSPALQLTSPTRQQKSPAPQPKSPAPQPASPSSPSPALQLTSPGPQPKSPALQPTFSPSPSSLLTSPARQPQSPALQPTSSPSSASLLTFPARQPNSPVPQRTPSPPQQNPARQPTSPAPQPTSPVPQPTSPTSQPPSPPSQLSSPAVVMHLQSSLPRGTKRKRAGDTASGLQDLSTELQQLRETVMAQNIILDNFTQQLLHQNEQHHRQYMQFIAIQHENTSKRNEATNMLLQQLFDLQKQIHTQKGNEGRNTLLQQLLEVKKGNKQ